jgi:hypothetical protein
MTIGLHFHVPPLLLAAFTSALLLIISQNQQQRFPTVDGADPHHSPSPTAAAAAGRQQQTKQCPEGSFLCPREGTCISQEWVGDGEPDCDGGFDELPQQQTATTAAAASSPALFTGLVYILYSLAFFNQKRLC